MSSFRQAKRGRHEMFGPIDYLGRGKVAGRSAIGRSFRKAKSYGKVEGVIRGKATSGTSAPEIKNIDLPVAYTVVSTGAPYIASLTAAIAEGTTGLTRVGQKILLKSIELEFNFQGTTNSVVNPPAFTVIGQGVFMDVFVVWDKQPNGGVPAVGAILVSSTTNLTFGNVNNLERFVTLRRKRVWMDESNPNEIWNLHVPLALATRFPDATGSPDTNDIYVVAVSSAGLGAGVNQPVIAYIARTKFTDA